MMLKIKENSSVCLDKFVSYLKLYFKIGFLVQMKYYSYILVAFRREQQGKKEASEKRKKAKEETIVIDCDEEDEDEDEDEDEEEEEEEEENDVDSMDGNEVYSKDEDYVESDEVSYLRKHNVIKNLLSLHILG